MKNKLLLSLTLIMVIMASIVFGAYAASDIKLIINGKVIQTDVQTIDGSSYVPLRVVSESLDADVQWDSVTRTITITAKDQSVAVYDAYLNFPSDEYPETAAHIKEAMTKGESSICTIDRDGADDNRSEALRGIPIKEGYDRDEWPMAMCAEGGTGADIAYVTASDNRGAGAWVGNQLEKYANGTRILFIIEDIPPQAASEHIPEPVSPEPAPPELQEVYYANCAAVQAAGAAPIHTDDPGYRLGLDRDGDGIGCEQ